MEKITCAEFMHIPAGTTIANGYSNGCCTAPASPGLYTLYELADSANCHIGWEWVREVGEPDA